jgi:6-phosphofructokinase 1
LIGVGVGGSMAILPRLAQLGGIPFVGIPKRIDNDVGATENSIGYDTAVMVVTEAVYRIGNGRINPPSVHNALSPRSR